MGDIGIELDKSLDGLHIIQSKYCYILFSKFKPNVRKGQILSYSVNKNELNQPCSMHVPVN